MKYANKIISTLMSLLILTACVPMEAFAATSVIFTLEEFKAGKAIKAGYMTPYELYTPVPFQAIQLKVDGVQLEELGMLETHATDWVLLNGPTKERIDLLTDEEFRGLFEQAPEFGSSWYKSRGGQQQMARARRDIAIRGPRGGQYVIYTGEIIPEPDKVVWGQFGLTNIRSSEKEEMDLFGRRSISAMVTGNETVSLTYGEAFAPAKSVNVEALVKGAPGWKTEELAAMYRAGQFGTPDTYAKFARVQAQQAKGGEEIVTILADGTRETTNVAKAGDFIITNPGGEQYIVDAQKFAKRYEAAMDLGAGWYKPKGAPQKFVKIDQDMIIVASWGEKQVLKKGAYLNVTNLNDIYGVAADEFRGTYKTIRALYQENLKGIRLLAMKVEQKLYKKFPKYSGVFFKRVLANDTDFMVKRLEQQAAKRAERNAAKAGAKKTALRAFGGALFGSALYFGITLATAPGAQAAPTSATKKSEVIKRAVAQVNGLNAEQKDMLEEVAVFMDPNARPLIMRDPALMERMGVYSAIIQSEEFDVDDAAEFIADELVSIEKQGNAQQTQDWGSKMKKDLDQALRSKK